jgi:hypothetical protein
MSLLAGMYMWKIVSNFKKYFCYKIIITTILIIGLVFGNLFIVLFEIELLHKHYFFQSRAVYLSLQWLRENTEATSIILANFKKRDTIISGFTGRFSLVTGGNAVLDNWRFKFIEDFYRDNTNDIYKKKMLKDLGINYVWYGKYERELGDFNPREADYLELVFASGEEEIYQVNFDRL